jgi:hypothetical protein
MHVPSSESVFRLNGNVINELIVKRVNQILPVYIIHFKFNQSHIKGRYITATALFPDQ